MVEIVCLAAILTLGVIVWIIVSQFDRQRKEWNAERSKLLDRIQAGSLMEYKQQERADKPREKKAPDPLNKETWL